MSESFLEGRISLWCGDSRDVLRGFEDCSFDSIVTDPPYALVSIVKRFANSPRSEAAENTENPYGRTGRGFMGQRWDNGETAFAVEFWAECLRVLKPGGHLIAFSGTRTYHRMTCAIEDAGFEIRDQIGWVFGSGFPKSHNAGNGWGTALKPAWEPICLGRKPIVGTVKENVAAHGVGAINVEACRVGTEERINVSASANEIYGQFQGAETEGRSAIGRWPANIMHDGSDEVLAVFPESGGSGTARKLSRSARSEESGWGMNSNEPDSAELRDAGTGSAARFFYTAKADSDDRIGSKHPTVKPVDLMQWLVRLVTPKGGTVLDPFAGTGTTAEACFREGMRCVAIERETEYQADFRRRMALCMAGPEERARESIKAKLRDKPIDLGPLFTATR